MRRALLGLGLIAAAGCGRAPLVPSLPDAGTPPLVDGRTGVVEPTLEVKDCPAFNTLDKMDLFFARRCAGNSLCHTTTIPWTDLRTPGVWRRLLDLPPRAMCTRPGPNGRPVGKLIDRANWRNSILLTKSQDPPVCPPGTLTSSGQEGWPMPPTEENQGDLFPKQPPLTAAERLCIESFVRAATGN